MADPNSQKAVVLLHVFYPELWPVFEDLLHRLDPRPWDLLVNVVEERDDADCRNKLLGAFPKAQIFRSSNLGMDVGGTLNLLNRIDLTQYDLALKLHTKLCPYNPALGSDWRSELLRACFEGLEDVYSTFAMQPKVMMIGSRRWMLECNDQYFGASCNLMAKQGLPVPTSPFHFIGGTMFWCRASVLQRLKATGIRQEDFEPGNGGLYSLAHVVERLLGALACMDGKVVGR